jgi:hypothetical protein
MSRLAASIVAVVVVLSFAFAREARADAPGETPPLRDTRAQHKSLLGAYLWTVAATSGPMAMGAIALDGCESDACGVGLSTLAVGSMVFGPSAGHFYAGEGVTTGLVLRGSAVTGIIFLALRDPYLDQPVVTVGGLLAAVGVWETGVIWDLVTLPRAVRRHNRTVDLLVAPVVTDRSAGLALTGAW